MFALKDEMIRVIRGKSSIDRDMIQQLLDENQAAIQAAQDALTAAQNKLEEIEQENKKAENDCSNLFTWASTYQNASFQQRQTILNQFIKEVRVGRDYDIEIIQAKLAEGKGTGFARWAKQHNLKEISRTLVFLQENKIGSIEEMQERVDAATARYHELGDSIKASEKRLAEIAVLKAHIINYAKTRPVYDAYRKTGYSKRFLETHRTEITLHKAAKAAFDEANLKTLPKVKALDEEYSKLLTEKKARYPDYRKAKEEMQELLRAKKNVELFFAEEKSGVEKMKSR